MSSKKRIIAIDILKVFAVLIVLNSHMEICYGKYSALATGGAIGDALFFFASGFMLFRGPSIRLDHFMKRRIARIYPTVFIVAIVGGILFGKKDDMISIILYGGGWFVSCIMIYYIIIWIIKRFLKDRLILVWGGIIIGILIWYYCFYESSNGSIYGNTYFKWGFFFIFMLQGAIMGSVPEKYTYSKYVVPKLLGCIFLWFLIISSRKYFSLISQAEWISIVPLYGITYYTYIFCCAPFWKKVYEHKTIGNILFIVGGLCLECYLIQFYLFTDKLNWLFPLNIPLLMIFILIVSYGVNFLSSAFSQTFSNNQEYDWKKCLLKKPKKL